MWMCGEGRMLRRVNTWPPLLGEISDLPQHLISYSNCNEKSTCGFLMGIRGVWRQLSSHIRILINETNV